MCMSGILAASSFKKSAPCSLIARFFGSKPIYEHSRTIVFLSLIDPLFFLTVLLFPKKSYVSTSRRYRKSSFYTSFQRVPNDFQLQDFFRRSSSNTQIHVKGEDPLYTYVFSHLWRNLIRFFLLRWFYCLQIHKRIFTCIVHGNWHGKLHCHSTLQIEKQSKKIRIIRKNFKNYWFFHL